MIPKTPLCIRINIVDPLPPLPPVQSDKGNVVRFDYLKNQSQSTGKDTGTSDHHLVSCSGALRRAGRLGGL